MAPCGGPLEKSSAARDDSWPVSATEASEAAAIRKRRKKGVGDAKKDDEGRVGGSGLPRIVCRVAPRRTHVNNDLDYSLSGKKKTLLHLTPEGNELEKGLAIRREGQFCERQVTTRVACDRQTASSLLAYRSKRWKPECKEVSAPFIASALPMKTRGNRRRHNILFGLTPSGTLLPSLPPPSPRESSADKSVPSGSGLGSTCVVPSHCVSDPGPSVGGGVSISTSSTVGTSRLACATVRPDLSSSTGHPTTAAAFRRPMPSSSNGRVTTAAAAAAAGAGGGVGSSRGRNCRAASRSHTSNVSHNSCNGGDRSPHGRGGGRVRSPSPRMTSSFPDIAVLHSSGLSSSSSQTARACSLPALVDVDLSVDVDVDLSVDVDPTTAGHVDFQSDDLDPTAPEHVVDHGGDQGIKGVDHLSSGADVNHVGHVDRRIEDADLSAAQQADHAPTAVEHPGKPRDDVAATGVERVDVERTDCEDMAVDVDFVGSARDCEAAVKRKASAEEEARRRRSASFFPRGASSCPFDQKISFGADGPDDSDRTAVLDPGLPRATAADVATCELDTLRDGLGEEEREEERPGRDKAAAVGDADGLMALTSQMGGGPVDSDESARGCGRSSSFSTFRIREICKLFYGDADYRGSALSHSGSHKGGEGDGGLAVRWGRRRLPPVRLNKPDEDGDGVQAQDPTQAPVRCNGDDVTRNGDGMIDGRDRGCAAEEVQGMELEIEKSARRQEEGRAGARWGEGDGHSLLRMTTCQAAVESREELQLAGGGEKTGGEMARSPESTGETVRETTVAEATGREMARRSGETTEREIARRADSAGGMACEVGGEEMARGPESCPEGGGRMSDTGSPPRLCHVTDTRGWGQPPLNLHPRGRPCTQEVINRGSCKEEVASSSDRKEEGMLAECPPPAPRSKSGGHNNDEVLLQLEESSGLHPLSILTETRGSDQGSILGGSKGPDKGSILMESRRPDEGSSLTESRGLNQGFTLTESRELDQWVILDSGVAVAEELQENKSPSAADLCGPGVKLQSCSITECRNVRTGTGTNLGARTGTGIVTGTGSGRRRQPRGTGIRLQLQRCSVVECTDDGVDVLCRPETGTTATEAGRVVKSWTGSKSGARIESEAAVETRTSTELATGTENSRTTSDTGMEPGIGTGDGIGMIRGTSEKTSGDGGNRADRMRVDGGSVLRRSNRKIIHSAIVREIVQDQLQFGCLLNKKDCPGLSETSFCELVDNALGTVQVSGTCQPQGQKSRFGGKGESSRQKMKADSIGCVEKKTERQRKEPANEEKDLTKAQKMDRTDSANDGVMTAEPSPAVASFAGYSKAVRRQKVRVGKPHVHPLPPSLGGTHISITGKTSPLVMDSQESPNERAQQVEGCQQHPSADRSDFDGSDCHSRHMNNVESGVETVKEGIEGGQEQSLEGYPKAGEFRSNKVSDDRESQVQTALPGGGSEARGGERVDCQAPFDAMFVEGKENLRWSSSEAKEKGGVEEQPVFRIREICRLFGGGSEGRLFQGRGEKRPFDGSLTTGGKQRVMGDQGDDGRLSRERLLDDINACALTDVDLSPSNDTKGMQDHVLQNMGSDMMADVPIEIGGLCRRVSSRGRVMRSVLMC